METIVKNSQIAIYLAGNIQKGHEKESEIFWSLEDQQCLIKELYPCKLTFLNPATRTDDLSDQKSVFGRDMTQVFFADVILVDARERRGLGVGAEMMWAKMNHIPVLTLAPKNTHYQKNEVKLLGVRVENWVHPFVESLSDAIIINLEEAASWLKKFTEGSIRIKGPESISEAMLYYQKSQLPHDIPMKQLIESNSRLKTRIDDFNSLQFSLES